MTKNKSCLVSAQTPSLSGRIDVPGDKSISHRALILSTMAIGETRIKGLLRGADVLATLQALQQLGGQIDDEGEVVCVHGVGMGGFISPDAPLDLENAGTGVRLLMGAVAGQPITASFTGDASLRTRPMRRITDPLVQMGAQIKYEPEKYAQGLLPVTITGAKPPLPIHYDSPIASAQIKSAILCAGLNARGQTIITEPYRSRDHSESLLRHFGAEITQTDLPDGRYQVGLAGEAVLYGKNIVVPRDPSSAAFPLVAALITPDSHITIPQVGLNPQRIGLLTTLLEMGGNIDITHKREEGGEMIGDIIVRSSPLKGVHVPKTRAASMIDEYPILAVAAACASGETIMDGIGELRVKETDRLAVMAEGLKACGVHTHETQDSLTVTGIGAGIEAGIGAGGERMRGGAEISSRHDHRIAMSFLVLGMVADQPITVLDTHIIATSFPDFADAMRHIGAHISDKL